MKYIIRSKNIEKTFGKGREKVVALDNVSLDIDSSDFMAIMEPSGSGKSTLLFALSGMDDVDSGDIEFLGENLRTLSEDKRASLRRRELGFVFQQPTMIKNLTLLDNIILPMIEDYSGEDLEKRALTLMRKMGIEELKNRNVTEVSGGQLQRGGICRALIANPKIIFGDEPTGALNTKTSEEIMDIFLEINKLGKAILLVTHDPAVAARAKRIVFMKDGKLAKELTLGEYQPRSLGDRIEIISKVLSELSI